MIEICPVPMSVGDLVIWARGDKQLLASIRRGCYWMIEIVMIEGKTALKSAGYLGIGSLPASPLCQWPECRQIVAMSQFLEQQVGQRSGRFSDHDSGVFPFVDQHDGAAQSPADHGHERTCKTRTHYGDIVAIRQRFPRMRHTELRRRFSGGDSFRAAARSCLENNGDIRSSDWGPIGQRKLGLVPELAHTR